MNTVKDRQTEVCSKYNSPIIPVNNDLRIGLAVDTLIDMPIYGVRLKPENGTEGWFIWGGNYSDEPTFFKPVHISHLNELLPIVIPYLALAPGYKFAIDNTGYEDVWCDPNVLDRDAI